MTAPTIQFGLSNATVNAIRQVFSDHPNVERVVIYGSRAKGDYRPGSDIDLTLHGDGLVMTEQFQIENELDDLLLPYKFDLSIYRQLTDSSLREHIERVGKQFYP
jgi:predicted nucleotidyltransferase